MCDASNDALGVVLSQRKPYAKARLIKWLLLLQKFD